MHTGDQRIYRETKQKGHEDVRSVRKGTVLAGISKRIFLGPGAGETCYTMLRTTALKYWLVPWPVWSLSSSWDGPCEAFLLLGRVASVHRKLQCIGEDALHRSHAPLQGFNYRLF